MARVKGPRGGPSLTRRTFLQWTSGSATTLMLSHLLAACDSAASGEVTRVDVEGLAIDPADWITVRRPDDLLVVDFGLWNLRRTTANGGRALVKSSSGPAFLVARFCPQHLHERTFGPNPTPPAEHRLADSTRLVFAIRDELLPAKLSIAGLLRLIARAGLNVAQEAASGSAGDVGGTVSGPSGQASLDALQTSIELPFRLALSPNERARFAHAVAPVDRDGRVELWHTRLGVGTAVASLANEKLPDLRTVRALVDLGDTKADPFAFPLEGSLSNPERTEIVKVSRTSAHPPIRVARLSLSTLGGSFEGALDVDAAIVPSALEQWKHRTSLGRDVEVTVVARGRLYGLGNRASLVLFTERRFRHGPSGPVAVLEKEYRIVVREAERSYHDDVPGHLRDRFAVLRRTWPFRRVRILTEKTPPLDAAPFGVNFLPSVDGKPLPFAIEAEDRRGEIVRFSYPLFWVVGDDGIAGSGDWPGSLPECALDGQRVAMVAVVENDTSLSAREATTFEVQTLSFDAEEIGPGQVGSGCRFYPKVTRANLTVEALAALSGAKGANFEYTKAYKDFEFEPNKNPHQVFLETIGAAAVADFAQRGADAIGGLVTPNLEVGGLSRLTGPVSKGVVASTVTAITGGDMFPVPKAGPNQVEDLLSSFCPKLFGCITLKDLLSASGVGLEDLAPKFVTEAIDEGRRFYDDMRRLLDSIDTGQLKAALTQAADNASAAGDAAMKKAAKDLSKLVDAAALRLDAAIGAIEGAFGGDDLKQAEEDIDFALDDSPSLSSVVSKLSAALTDGDLPKIIGYFPASFPAPASALQAIQHAVVVVADALEAVSGALAALREALKAVVRARRLARDKVVKVDWRPKLPKGQMIAGVLVFTEERGLLLAIEARAKQRAGQKAGVDVLCSLDKFELHLLGLLILEFKQLQFRQRAGKKPEIDVILGNIKFEGMLSFVETLKSVLPLDGFSDPPAVEVTASGLDASYSLALPNVAVGMFSLENMRILARLRVPFLGDAVSFRFEFSRRESPFLVTVSLLGGGGWFALELTPGGLRQLEASITFGAHVSLDFGVASGSVSVLGGFFYTFDGTKAHLGGFLHIRGEVDVLGLISACIQLSLELEYVAQKLVGRAVLEIEVSLAFIHKTVRLETERKFAGANGDPPFEDVVSESDFLDYCAAFAA